MKLNTRYTILISTFGVIFIIPLFFFFNRHINSTIEKESVITLEKNLNLISSSIEELLKNEIEMTLFLSDRPALKDLLKKNNSEFIQLSEVERRNELTRKNEVWITSNSENELVKEILDSQTSSLLKSVSSSFHNRYGEIFITNKFGAVVGSTSKLTTYLHNYKKWWVNAYNEDRGRIFIDDRGFDESAGSYVLGIVAPMFDKEELIGIIKCNVNIQGLLQKIKKYEESIGNNWSLIVSRQNGSIIYKRETEPLTEQLSESLMVKTEKQIIYKNWIIQDEELILNMTLPINSTFSNSVYDFGGTQESIDHKFGNTGENWNLTAFISKKDLLSNNAESRKKTDFTGISIHYQQFIICLGT